MCRRRRGKPMSCLGTSSTNTSLYLQNITIQIRLNLIWTLQPSPLTLLPQLFLFPKLFFSSLLWRSPPPKLLLLFAIWKKKEEEGKNLWALCINPVRVLQGLLPHSGPPGNHGNEVQERTLSCWRPEPGFGGGNEQRGGGGGGEGAAPLLNFTSHSVHGEQNAPREKIHQHTESDWEKLPMTIYSGTILQLSPCSGQNSPFWSPGRVCFAPKPFRPRLGLRMLQTRSPCKSTWKRHKSVKVHEIRPQSHKQTHRGEAWQSMRHPVIGRRGAHASFLPRPLGNGISHHHALLHLAEFTEVLLQPLCGHSKQGAGLHIDTKQAAARDERAVSRLRWCGWRQTMGVGPRCVCVPLQLQHGHIQPGRPRGAGGGGAICCC